MANLNVILSGATIQVVNTVDSTTRVNSAQGNPTLPAAEDFYNLFFPIAAGGGTVITLPAATVWVAHVRNLGGINGTPAGNITVRFTATGGAQIAVADSPIIVPNGVFSYWNPTEGAGGLTGLTLIASVASTPVEILLAA